MMLRTTICIVSAILVVSVAHADNSLKNVEAQAHMLRGMRLYNLEEFDKAIEEFKAGAVIEDSPVFFYNLGQAYRKLGKYESAIWYYERFLSYRDELIGIDPAIVQQANNFIQTMKTKVRDEIEKPLPPQDEKLKKDPVASTHTVSTAEDKKDPVPLSSREDRSGRHWKWAAAGSGLALATTGSYLIAIDGNGTCDSAPVAECPEIYQTKVPGFVAVGLGATLMGIGVYLWVRDRKVQRSSTVALFPRGDGWFVSFAQSL